MFIRGSDYFFTPSLAWALLDRPFGRKQWPATRGATARKRPLIRLHTSATFSPGEKEELIQAVGLGFVISPLWGSKTAADFARLGFVR